MRIKLVNTRHKTEVRVVVGPQQDGDPKYATIGPDQVRRARRVLCNCSPSDNAARPVQNRCDVAGTYGGPLEVREFAPSVYRVMAAER